MQRIFRSEAPSANDYLKKHLRRTFKNRRASATPSTNYFKNHYEGALKIPGHFYENVLRRLVKIPGVRYNEQVYFTFWKLVKTPQGYIVKKYIDIYKEMSVIYT